MKTELFDYELPEHLIARYPAKERDQSRLLVLDRQKQALTNHIFSEIVDYIQAGDLVVFTNPVWGMSSITHPVPLKANPG